MTRTKLSHDFCLCVTLQQGQIQVLIPRLGHESREGHERSISSAGLTDQTAAQERNWLLGTLRRGDRQTQEHYSTAKVKKKTRKKRELSHQHQMLPNTPSDAWRHHLLQAIYYTITLQRHNWPLAKTCPFSYCSYACQAFLHCMEHVQITANMEIIRLIWIPFQFTLRICVHRLRN